MQFGVYQAEDAASLFTGTLLRLATINTFVRSGIVVRHKAAVCGAMTTSFSSGDDCGDVDVEQATALYALCYFRVCC